MTRLRSMGAGLVIGWVVGVSPAVATPIAGGEVIGDWTLTITATERRGMNVSVEGADGGRPDLPLSIRSRAGGGIACVLRGEPTECRIDDGALVIVMPTRSGGARMTFTLSGRTPQGFIGTARVRVRLLPFGGDIGTVAMVRR